MLIPQSDRIIIPALILAAGNSGRLGKPKQLLEINGKTLLAHIIDAVITTGLFELSIVLGAYQEEIEKTIDNDDIKIVHNSDWSKGIGTSIKVGMNSIINNKPEAVLILSSDQPLINSAYINRMYGHFFHSDYGIIASGYGGAYGIPVLFRKKYFNEIMDIGEKSGCRGIISNNLDDTCLLDCPEGEYDIDTQEDFQNISRLL